MRARIEQAIEQTDILQDIDIKAVAKESKLGWVKTLLIAAVWPLIKKALSKKIAPKIVDIIENVLKGV